MAYGSVSIGRLILVPVLVSLAVTVLRLTGELLNWPPLFFNKSAGGFGAVVGITWLAVVFAIYFAIRLSGAADVPASKGRAILMAVLALAVTFGGTFLLFSGGSSPKPILQTAGVVVVIAALAIMRRVWPTYWNALFAYALGARIPVLAVMYLAIKGRWGTHYDVLPPGMSFQSFTQEYLVSALFPQLFLWVPFTVIFCGIFGLVVLAVRRRRVSPSS
jgi:hypothetical protein